MDANTRRIRRKGLNWERAVQRKLAAVFGEGRVRFVDVDKDGPHAPDVIAPHMWVECKAHRMTNPRGALRQAGEESKCKGKWPIAICKDDRDPPHVTMYLSDFLALIAQWQRRTCK